MLHFTHAARATELPRSIPAPIRAPQLHELDPEALADALLERRREALSAALDAACSFPRVPSPSRLQSLAWPLQRRLRGFRWKVSNALRLARLGTAALLLSPPSEWRAALGQLGRILPEDVRSRTDAAARMSWAPGLAGIAPLHGSRLVDDAKGTPTYRAVFGDTLDGDTRWPLDGPVAGRVQTFAYWDSEGSSSYEQTHPPIAVARFAWVSNGSPAFEGVLLFGELAGPCTYWSEDGTLDEERSGFYVDGQRTGALTLVGAA